MKKADLEIFMELASAVFDREHTDPVSEVIQAKNLEEILDLAIQDDSITSEQWKSLLYQLIKYTPRTSGPRFFNQLFGGRTKEGVIANLLAVILNNSMYTYKVAGPMVGVERTVVKALCECVGFPETADGTFTSGGSLTNLMAMLMARDAARPRIRYEGHRELLTIYTSSQSHYSIPKNAGLMGLGRDQVRYIDVDEEGRMIPELLSAQVQADLEAGYKPFFVNITAGTTVLGAFDPIRPIHSVCAEYELWMHVDGAYCGAVIFSEQYKHLIDGVELADSFSLNAHKMLNSTLTCSVIITKERKCLLDTFSNEAEYLYQTDSDLFNLGKISLQCGRRNDAFKFWSLWKSRGTKGLAKMVEQQFHLANHARNYVKNHPDYTLCSFENSISVCFNYKNIPADILCSKLYEHAQLMVSHGRFNDQLFVRLVTINSANSIKEIDGFFAVIEQFVDQHF